MERFGERRPVDPAVSLQMDEANQFYAQAQYAEASARAKAVLEGQPDNPRMLRVVVSSACMMGASAEAATYFNRLTNPRDRDQMTRRCREAGIELP